MRYVAEPSPIAEGHWHVRDTATGLVARKTIARKNGRNRPAIFATQAEAEAWADDVNDKTPAEREVRLAAPGNDRGHQGRPLSSTICDNATVAATVKPCRKKATHRVEVGPDHFVHLCDACFKRLHR